MDSSRPLPTPPLDPGFRPAALCNAAFRALAHKSVGARKVTLILERADNDRSRYDTVVLAADHPEAERNEPYLERLVKFLLWQQGAKRILIAGAPELAARLAKVYAPGGSREFDARFIGERVYLEPLRIEAVHESDLPEPRQPSVQLGRHLGGCRIGFDLGGSDRKCAAVIDGRVVFSEEVRWDPYFQSDPAYHLEGIHHSLQRAAAHLPRVDAIGGSAAGIYVDNEMRVASLFRGVTTESRIREARSLFRTLRERWHNVPLDVINDGEVTALAGSMALGRNEVLGLSFGTSQAAGFVDRAGNLTPWLNELAFAPVDYQPGAPVDEWSGDAGCGVQYFSQQAVGRLAARTSLAISSEAPLPDRLLAVQEAMQKGDPQAAKIYETIGVYLGYSLAHYREFIPFRNLLVLGRVASGAGGDLIIATAKSVLATAFPALASDLEFHTPDESSKRHGQAIAAASLPALPLPS